MLKKATATKAHSANRKQVSTVTLPWLICILVGLFYGYDYLLRVMPSVMIEQVMGSYHLTAFKFGLFSVCYFYAYTPMQLLAGAFVDKYNRSRVLFITCIISALGGIVLALSNGYALASFGRIVMGLGSAFAFVGALKMAAIRLPQKYFAYFVAILLSFGILGALVADFALSRAVQQFGWRHAVMMTSLAGVVLAIAMIVCVKDRPFWLTKPPVERTSFRQLFLKTCQQFKNIKIWLIGLVGACMLLPIAVAASLWQVVFLDQRYGLSAVSASQITALLFVGFAIGAPFYVFLSNKIKRRRLPLIIGSFFLFVTMAVGVSSDNLTELELITLQFLIGFFASSHALLFAMAKEINLTKYTGVTFAAVNALFSLGALVFDPFVGYFLTKNWQGHMLATGVHFYGPADYRVAFSVLVLIVFAGFIMTFFLPETNCMIKASKKRQQLNAAVMPRDINKLLQ